MNDRLPKTISGDDSACGWSFTLFFLGSCARLSQNPITLERASLLLTRMDVALIKEGLIMRPYERFREQSGVLELWSLTQFGKGQWDLFNRLFRIQDDTLVLNPGFEEMLDSTDYLNRNALKGSTCGLSDDIMDSQLNDWLSLSNENLHQDISSYFGRFNTDWQSFGDLIPAMLGPDKLLRDHLAECWSDRVAIDAAFNNI